jgi:malate dehydrogenase
VSRTKITVVGAGSVGATCARHLAARDYADIVLVDVAEGLARGTALDLNHAAPLAGYEPRIAASADYADTAGSDICVVAAAAPRRSAMGHDDRLARNGEIVDAVVGRLAQRSPDAILIVVSDQLDAMCHVALDASGFPRQRVIGMAGVLHSARLRTFLAWELGVSVRDVTALVLGGNGDSMVPMIGCATVAGAPVVQRLAPERIERVVRRTREAGTEIAGLLERGAAYHAPAAAVVEMIDAIVNDQSRVLPCAALCQGEYGIRDLFVGVPCRLAADGVVEIVEFELAGEERESLLASAESVRELVAAMPKLRAR